MTQACDTCSDPTVYRRRFQHHAGLILALLILAITGFVFLRPDGTGSSVVGVRDVMNGGDEYVGRTVTVSGVVAEVLSPGAFTLDGGLGVDDLVIIGGTGVPSVAEQESLASGVIVKATGEVRRFDGAAIREEFGVELPGDGLNGDPILVVEVLARSGSQ